MKKLFFMAAIAIAAVTANAQNIQLHYDFGRNIYPDEEETTWNAACITIILNSHILLILSQ